MPEGKKVREHFEKYLVTYLFVALSVLFILVSGMPINYVASQLLLRLNRNAFIVLALIIPIIAGMGINFAITIGAMAAQIGLLLTINWGVTGVPGILLAVAITLPLASFFGFLIGKLLNKMKGQETIGSLILGYFANGAYQLLFLFIFGSIIPLNSNVTIVGASGVQNTLNLTGSVGLYKALDGILSIPLITAFCIVAVILSGFVLFRTLFRGGEGKAPLILIAGAVLLIGLVSIPEIAAWLSGTAGRIVQTVACILAAALAIAAVLLFKKDAKSRAMMGLLAAVAALFSILNIPAVMNALNGPSGTFVLTPVCALLAVAALAALFLIRKTDAALRLPLTLLAVAALLLSVIRIPMIADVFNGKSGQVIRIPLVTWLLILALCLFNFTIMRTRLGQKFRAVGQSQTVANASGINVDRTRIIAIMISTVLAGWGQIVFMQSDGIGTFQTYAAHEQVGLYAGAAILVGGASIDRATNLQALVGTFLFHSLFITAQSAATVMFGNSAVGEYFRAFLSYGVIALALIMYAWRSAKQKKAGQMNLAEQRAAKE